MPCISQFRGISIYMYTEPGARHRLPHFHAHYAEFMASFAISPPGLLEGALPRPQLRLALAWAEVYQAELEENWHVVQAGQRPRQLPGI
jgi:Domain of unknown function (DUF4160)